MKRIILFGLILLSMTSCYRGRRNDNRISSTYNNYVIDKINKMKRPVILENENKQDKKIEIIIKDGKDNIHIFMTCDIVRVLSEMHNPGDTIVK